MKGERKKCRNQVFLVLRNGGKVVKIMENPSTGSLRQTQGRGFEFLIEWNCGEGKISPSINSGRAGQERQPGEGSVFVSVFAMLRRDRGTSTRQVGDGYLGAGGGAAMPRENGKVRGER